VVERSNTLKATITIGIIFCALLFFVAGYVWRAPRSVHTGSDQKPWNPRAIGTSFTGVEVRELDTKHAAVDFFYNLENQTSTDFQLTPGSKAVIMKRLKVDGSLSADRDARLVSAAFVPTNNRTRIAVEITDLFDWPTKQDAAADQSLRDFVARETSGLEGFVIFDQISRYQIELPIDLATSASSAAELLKKGG
jgi:hypothetical protein